MIILDIHSELSPLFFSKWSTLKKDDKEKKKKKKRDNESMGMSKDPSRDQFEDSKEEEKVFRC